VSNTSFVEIHAQCVAEWLSESDEPKTDQELGERLMRLVLQLERLRAGVTAAGPQRDEVDHRTDESLDNPTKLGPEFSREEAVFRRLRSDPSSAIAYLRTAIEQRSKAQSDRASKDRPGRRDCITGIIDELVAVNPKISAKNVGTQLELDCDITILEGEYSHIIERSTLKETNLASRVSDARKRRLKSFSG
jgi:hypothetical protein